EALDDIDNLNTALCEQESIYIEMIDDIEKEISKLKIDNHTLNLRINELNKSNSTDEKIDTYSLVSIISNRLNPESILKFLQILIPDRLIVLDSAMNSAIKS